MSCVSTVETNALPLSLEQENEYLLSLFSVHSAANESHNVRKTHGMYVFMKGMGKQLQTEVSENYHRSEIYYTSNIYLS